MSKLQNIKAIRQMLDGTHRTQTRTRIGLSDADSALERSKTREVGETWEEKNTKGEVIAIWEQRKGYRVRKGINHKVVDEIRTFLNEYPNCYDDCRTKKKSRLDERFRMKFGRCADCQARYETKLKLSGEWKEYEQRQLKANADAFFEQADKEIALVYQSLVSSSIDYANSNGTMDSWEADPEMAERMMREYKGYKEIAYERINNYNTQNEE